MLQVRAGGRAPKLSQKVLVGRVPPDVRNEEIPHPPSASIGVWGSRENAKNEAASMRAPSVQRGALRHHRSTPRVRLRLEVAANARTKKSNHRV